MNERALRELIARHLDWHDAHVDYHQAVADFPAAQRAEVPAGLVHSAWQIVEHIRRAQADILDFCLNPDYVSPAWPEAYWPDVAPGNDGEWDASIAGFEEDVAALKALARDEAVDLAARVPTGNERQTYARELLLVADHTAYHLGQLVAVRRLLGAWSD